jgi:hypothetical protein
MSATRAAVQGTATQQIGGRRRRWYVVSPYAVRDRDGRWRPAPGRPSHAKEAGTALTACGLPASTWHRFWDVSFTRPGPEHCPACAEVLAGS